MVSVIQTFGVKRMTKSEKREIRQKWIETLGGFDGGPGPTEKYKHKIMVDCIEGLEDSINANSRDNAVSLREYKHIFI